MVKNKHLQRLAIILSCAGLMSNTLACGPDASESREYTVKLLNPGGNIDNSAKISFTQQQIDKIKNGECPEGFVRLLNTTFNDTRKGQEFDDFVTLNYPGGLKMEGEEIIVSSVKQKLWFHIRENKNKYDSRLYIYYDKFSHDEVCLDFKYGRIRSGDYYNVSDLNGVLEDFKSLYIHGRRIFFARTNILNHDDLMKFCDGICFLQELSQRRSEIMDNIIQFLRSLRFHPNTYRLSKYSVNEYILIAQYVNMDSSEARYEFFLENESEKNDWNEEEDYRSSHLEFFDQSKMILRKVKFFDWEYSFKKKCYLMSDNDLKYIKKVLNQEKNNKLEKLILCSALGLKISDLKAAWESFNLEEVFAPIEKELSFIESLAEARGEDMWDMMEFLTKISVGPSINKFLLTQDPETKNYSMKCILERYSILLYELGIESTFSLPTELLSSEEFNRMIDDMKSDGANIFVRSIKLLDKEHRFQDDIDLVKRGRNMLDEISKHLGTHMKEKLDYILFHETKERWNSIDLAEAMRPIEEMND